MSTFRAENQSISQIENVLILKNPSNITFREFSEFRGACNNQFFFLTKGYYLTQLLGYQQFVLSGQPKLLKKYNLEEGVEVQILNKSNELFIIFPGMGIKLYKFDSCHNLKECGVLFTEPEFEDYHQLHQYIGRRTMIEIGINYNEDMFAFQNLKEIYFYNRGKDGKWNVEQTIQSHLFYEMRKIKFNETSNKMIAIQTKWARKEKYIFLNIFEKNQSNVWSVTHSIQQMFDEIFYYCFLNEQQFVCFKQHQNEYVMQVIYTICEEDINEQVQETLYFERVIDNFHLFEIKSKHLIVLYCSKCFFCFSKQPKFLKLLTKVPLKHVEHIDYNEDQNSQFLFFYIYDIFNSESNSLKIQVYRINLE